MVWGVRGACEEERGGVTVGGLEKGMYMAGYPKPDLLVRTSGEWRTINFLLWQSGACMLHSPGFLSPEFSLRHLVCAVVQYQHEAEYVRDVRCSLWEFECRGGFRN
ncbi:hypothetical protein KFK09_028879 [Dendrobium nobile]|uniref:Uncharacterized protein n=1 Tax=Dendrobium nobile TaxID=94219 RepID=A0A8T3A3P0_DENNO|nr:hypothetical protein KFK09_028879 [Dendrobium nobile]